MGTATLSSRGQLVIPVDVRETVDWRPGDKVSVVVSPDHTEVRLRRKETLEQMADRLSGYVPAGTEPLLDVHGFFQEREPRT